MPKKPIKKKAAKKKATRPTPGKPREELNVKQLKAVPDDDALDKLCNKIYKAVKSSELTAKDISIHSGLAMASCRKIMSGNLRDMKLSTISRLFPVIGLEIV